MARHKNSTRVSVRVRVKLSTKAYFTEITDQDGMPPGEVVDTLVEQWALANDAELAKKAGIKAQRRNRFEKNVPRETTGSEFLDALNWSGPEFTEPAASPFGGLQRERRNGTAVLPSAITTDEVAPNAEAEIPPSQRARQ